MTVIFHLIFFNILSDCIIHSCLIESKKNGVKLRHHRHLSFGLTCESDLKLLERLKNRINSLILIRWVSHKSPNRKERGRENTWSAAVFVCLDQVELIIECVE